MVTPVAYPRLSDAQLARLRSYGTPREVEAGEVLYRPGDATYDLIVTEDATVEIVQPATRDAPEESLVRFGPASFLAAARQPEDRGPRRHRDLGNTRTQTSPLRDERARRLCRRRRTPWVDEARCRRGR
jgi:hypothetical protein